jgi:tetratricopeptide (TPR) repeat protein
MYRAGFVLSLTLLFCAACASNPEPEPEMKSAAPESLPPASQGAPFEAASEPNAAGLTDATSGRQDPQPQASQETLEQAAQRQTLEQQKRAFLVSQHIATARALRDELKLEEAASELAAALELEPENAEAKMMLSEVNGLLGRPGSEAGMAQDLTQQYQLRLEQMRSDAGAALARGKEALQRGEFDLAIAEFTIAQNHVRWAPAGFDWQGLDAEVAGLLEQARSTRTEANAAAEEEARKAAYSALQEEERADQQRRDAEVANILDQAIAAFERGDYDEAMDLSDQALRRDPRNERAQEIRESSFRAGRQQVRDDYVLAKREQFSRWREELSAMRVPWTDIVTLPDQDFWNRITEERSQRRGIDLTQTKTPAERVLEEQVKTVRIPGLQVAEQESLRAVIDLLRTYTDLPLVVDPAAENAALDAGVVFTFSLQNPLTVEQALNIITRAAGEEVTWTIRNEAILITTRERARGQLIIYNHDVQDLVFGMTDFLGPRIDRLRLLAEMEDDDGGGPFGGIGEKPRFIDIENLSTLIQENVEPGTWSDEGVRIDAGEGYIVIVHTPEVHAKVRQFLNDLRRFSSSLVTIESKFMTVASNWIQEIGVDFRGLENTEVFKDLDDITNGLEDNASRGLDNGGLGAASGNPSSGFFYDDGGDGNYKGHTENYFGDPLGKALSTIGGLTAQWTFLNDLEVSAVLRAIEKSADFQLVNNQVLSVKNTQRAYVSVVNQKAYIQDFDVEVAQFQAVADPQVNVLIEGVVLDVRPTIHHDRKYLTLEIQPTVAKVVALRTYASTLGGNTAPVEFQLPELEVQSVFTTAVIPDGGSILLGGLSNLRNVERRAEVPWLAKIPIVGFFFKNEGYSDENKTLMILIRAHITDVQDELARLERTSR